MSDVSVSNNPDESRYEARLGGTLAGIARYRLTASTINFFHTEVLDEFEGRGVASELVRSALDAVRADGALSVDPTCPFFKSFIERHPEYADLVHRSEPGKA